jgi:tetratricopeptide (TPR) repeat protein
MLRRLVRKRNETCLDEDRPANMPHQEPRFKYMSMAGEVDRKSISQSSADGGGRDVRADIHQIGNATVLQPKIGHVDSHDDNPALNSLRVQVLAPERMPPSENNAQKHEQSRHEQPSGSTNQGHIRARQKLSSLARQHQQLQRQSRRIGYSPSTAFVVDSPVALSDGMSTVTSDTSDTPIHNHQQQQRQLIFNYNSIVHPSLPMHLSTCVEEVTDNICRNGESSFLSLESSYCSKHDFHNLPRAASPAEHTNGSTLKTNNDVITGKGNDRSKIGENSCSIVQYYDHHYRPNPPQKRRGGAPSMSAWEKRQCSSGHRSNESDNIKTFISREEIGMQVEVIDDGKYTEGKCVVITPNSKMLSSGTTSASPAEDALPAVTPSPPPISPGQKKLRHRPQFEPQSQQQPRRSEIPPAVSTAPTAKIANTSHLFVRLLKGHQVTKSPNKEELMTHSHRQEEEMISRQQSHHRPQQLQQLIKSIRRDPEDTTHEIITPAPPVHQQQPTSKKETEGKPPDDLPNLQQLRKRPDPPPDPPAEYRHYPSKGSGSAPPQKSSLFQPPRNPNQSNNQPAATLYPPMKCSAPHHHNINDTKLHEIHPSQNKPQIVPKQERHQVQSEWEMPLPLVKENSKISNFSSGFFTVQSSQTESSKFWDEVEGFPDLNGAFEKSEDNSKGGYEFRKSHLTDVKRDFSLTEDASNYQRNAAALRQSSAFDQPTHKLNASMMKSTKKSRTSSLETIYDDDSDSNAFSLIIPINRNGDGFDDSDISTLHMNDSATVYFQLAGGTGDGTSDYWKKKHDRLKNDTKVRFESNSIHDEEEVQHQHRHQDQNQNQHLQDIFRHVGQLERKEANHDKPKAIQKAARSTLIKLDPTESKVLQGGRHHCSLPFKAFDQLLNMVSKLEILDTKQHHTHSNKTAAEEVETFVEQTKERNDTKETIQERQSALRSKNLLPLPLDGSSLGEKVSEMHETGASGLIPLGFVQLDEGQQHDTSNDVALLMQWDKHTSVRYSKSLADDLTAGASRLSRGIASKSSSSVDDGDQNEMSDNARRIFDTAIKKGMNVSTVGRSKTSIAGSHNCTSSIPIDYVSWFELPSPGIMCVPLLPLLDASQRKSIDSDVSPLNRVNDTIDMSFALYLSRACEELARNDIDEQVKHSMCAIIADGDNGSIRFADASIHLRGIADAAKVAISRRQFQDAIEIYKSLVSSCQTFKGSKLGLVGQLLASSLHNLSVLHMWAREYDQAMPYCRETLRIKTELLGEKGSINSWADLGLINFAIGAVTSALASFRKAVQMSSNSHPEGQLTGKLVNNMACVNFDFGKMLLVQSQFKQSIQLQRGGYSISSLDDVALSSKDDLFSISITIFNIGVACARQNQWDAAISYLEACYAIQQAVLEDVSELIQNTAYYLDSMRVLSLTTSPKAFNNGHGADQSDATPNVDHQNEFEPQSITKIKQVELCIESKPKNLTITGQSEQVSYPMICLGDLRVEATISERVSQSLEGCSYRLGLQNFGGVRDLLCRRPAVSPKHKVMSQSIIHYGLLQMKKREVQSELHRNLERYGPRHPNVGSCYHKLGLLYLFSSDYNDAVTSLENSVKIYVNAMGVRSPDVASTLMLKGLAQLALERFDDSMASMLRVLSLRQDTVGRKHPELGQILNNLACVQYELGDYKKAELLFQEALDLQREAFTTESVFLNGVSKVLCNSAFLHAKSGSFPKALIELEGALQIRKDILFEDYSLDDILYNMAHILAIKKLQHGAMDLTEITEEIIAMLRTARIS